MSTDKSPVRVEIERQILAALYEEDRPMTARELLPIVDAAEDAKALVRILSHMRSAGDIWRGPEVAPGEPGGMDGRGARPVASYCLPHIIYDHNRQSMESIMTKPEPAIRQGKSADIDLIAALKMSAAEDDDGEACLDAADASHNGDEFEMPISGNGELQYDPDDVAFKWTPEMADRRQAYADGVEFERDVLELRELAEQAALDVADALIRGSHLRAWEAVQRLHRAVVSFSQDYV